MKRARGWKFHVMRACLTWFTRTKPAQAKVHGFYTYKSVPPRHRMIKFWRFLSWRKNIKKKKKHGNPVWRLKRRFVSSAVFLFPCDVYVTTRFCRRQTAPGARGFLVLMPLLARSHLTQAYASRPWKRRCNLMLSFVFRLTRVSPFTKKVFGFIFCNVKMFQWIAPENIYTPVLEGLNPHSLPTPLEILV